MSRHGIEDTCSWLLESQEFRPEHISGGLEDHVCPEALADCRSFRAEALAKVNAELDQIKSTSAYAFVV